MLSKMASSGVRPRRGLQATSEGVGADEVGQMGAALLVAVVVVALERRVPDRAVHPSDMNVGPSVPRLGQAMVDIAAGTGAIEAVGAEGLAGCNRLPDDGGGQATLPSVVKWVPLSVSIVCTL